MLKSLQMKLVLILMLLVVAVMAVVGVFLVNSVTAYNRSDFQRQMVDFFALRGEELDKGLSACNGDLDQMEKVLEAYNGGLGLDDHRNFYILDGKTGEFLTSSESRDATPFRELTPNMITAMEGEVGQTITALSPYFDVALPVDGGNYVLAVVDDKGELDELTWTMFTILIRSLMFGLAVTILLSFILARTITNPVQRLTRPAHRRRGLFPAAPGGIGGRDRQPDPHLRGDGQGAGKHPGRSQRGAEQAEHPVYLHGRRGGGL